jgi:hypothetical protein
MKLAQNKLREVSTGWRFVAFCFVFSFPFFSFFLLFSLSLCLSVRQLAYLLPLLVRAEVSATAISEFAHSIVACACGFRARALLRPLFFRPFRRAPFLSVGADVAAVSGFK